MPISRIPGVGLDSGSSGVAPSNLSTGGPYWDGSGNVGIGTSSPAKRLTVANTTDTTTVGNNAVMTVQAGEGATINSVAEIGFAYRTFSGTNPLCTIGYQLTSNAGVGAGALTFSTRSVTTDTAPSERMRIDTSGNVGIGGAPLYKLDVIGTISGGSLVERIWNTATAASTQSVLQIATGASSERYVNLAVNHTAQYLQNAGVGITTLYQDYDTQFFRNNAGTLRATIDSSGNFLVAATTATAKVTIGAANLWTTGASFSGASGNGVWNTGFTSQALNVALQTPFTIAAGAVYAVSDVRVKENIQPIPSGLAFVNAVQPVQFDWKEDKTVDTGYIAQDLLAKGFGHLVSAAPDATMEELVHEDGNVSPAGIRFIAKYDSVVPILHKAIQEQQAMIDELKAKVAALEGIA